MKLLKSNTLAKTTLAVALSSIFTTVAYAKNTVAVATNDEVQQLRAEVNALKALLEQQLPQMQAQQQQQAMNVQHLQQQVEQDKKRTLELKTKGGAEAKIYGFVRADASYELKGGNGQFSAIDKADLDKRSTNTLNATLQTTRIGLDFKTPIEGANVGGKIEGDFYNNNFRIRHAYLTYNNWLIGQAWSTFSDLDINPDAMEFGSLVGTSAERKVQVRYSNKLNDTTKYSVSLEKNGKPEQRVPSLIGRVDHEFLNNKAHVSARALVTEARGKPDGADKYDQDFAWSVGLGGAYHVSDNLTLTADYHHAKGDGDHVKSANAAYVFDGNNIVLNELDSIALSGTYKFTPKLRSSIGYGYIKHKDGAYARQNPEKNKTVYQGWVNAIYSPVSPVSFGVEYIYGERETFSGEKGEESRVSMMAKYQF